MKKSSLALVALTLIAPFAGSALASEGAGCHFHGSAPAAKNVVIDCALQRKATLVNSGKLDKSWEGVKPEKAEQVEGKKGKEWKVSFKNEAATDASKNTLYVFMSPAGNYIAANFTGN